MPSKSMAPPGLTSFLKSLNKTDPNSSIEHFISLLKRRQIRNSRSVAIATAELLLRVIAQYRWQDVNQLITHIKSIGRRLTTAQPREMAVGNIVRRVLGLIREESEGDGKGGNASAYSDAGLDSITGRKEEVTKQEKAPSAAAPKDEDLQRPAALTRQATFVQGAQQNSMFSLLSHPRSLPQSNPTTPPSSSHAATPQPTITQHVHHSTGPSRDLKPGIIEGLQEILDELSTVDDQIASYSLDHIHSNEIILTHGSSLTVQKFLLKAAAKRTFTVILAEGFPNDHEATHARVVGAKPTGPSKDFETDPDDLPLDQFQRTLASAGISVIVIADAAVYALMSRVNKVILGTHAVLANGGLLAAAGARTIAKAAREHSTPVVVVTGVYKLSPVYPFDWERLVEVGDPGRVVDFEDPELVEKVNVINPVYDYVPAELVDLYVTNLGGHAPSFLYRIVSDHYRAEDVTL
ncbi:hypothetical protein DFH27DRAFT_62896 [Peziza echinospora]|nr:hypothetical protein DFH27DRAFT_62896 [Peziza echinospora]